MPTGTVSFVSTDMVGFRRLLRMGSEYYAAVMEEHDRLLRGAFEQEGYVVDVMGDSFLVAFRRPQDAVHAAAAAQQAIGSGDWPDGRQPEVNIGIHTGEAVRAGSRYFSVALIRALHVCAAASGGQVLLSHATESLLDTHDLGWAEPARPRRAAVARFRRPSPPLRGRAGLAPAPAAHDQADSSART